MTWLKIGDEFGDDCARAALSDAAFRTHVEGLSWVMKRESGPRIEARDVRRFAETADPQSAVLELLAAGYWRRESGGFVIEHHMVYQPEPDEIAARRQASNERVRKHRRRRAEQQAGPVYREALRNARGNGVTRDGSGRVGPSLENPQLQEEQGAREDDDPWAAGWSA